MSFETRTLKKPLHIIVKPFHNITRYKFPPFLSNFHFFVSFLFSIFLPFTYTSVGFSAPRIPDCKRPLGMENGQILNESITASSQENENAGPENARLNFTGAWSPYNIFKNQWLQVDFGAETRVTGISTQGHHDFDTWVESYTLRYSDDGLNFEQYQPELYTKVTIEKQWGLNGLNRQLSQTSTAKNAIFLPSNEEANIRAPNIPDILN